MRLDLKCASRNVKSVLIAMARDSYQPKLPPNYNTTVMPVAEVDLRIPVPVKLIINTLADDVEDDMRISISGCPKSNMTLHDSVYFTLML